MTDPNLILDAPTPVAARELEQASAADRWWHVMRQQCDMFAQNHGWADAAAHLVDPRIRLRVAHARVLRGEDLEGQDLSREEPGDRPAEESGFWAVPLRLQTWEAQHWDSRYATHYRAQGWGSGGWTGFPSERREFPMLLRPGLFHGEVGRIETLGEWELSSWIEWVTTVAGTAEEAVAHQIEVGGCGHSKDAVRAAVIDFAEIYPALITVFGGAAAYGGAISESLGRLEVWRLLGALAGSTRAEDINELVARIRCVTWRDPCDEIWYLHLAMEDDVRRVCWVLDGQDFD